MTTAQRLRNLTVPIAPVDVVLGKNPISTHLAEADLPRVVELLEELVT